MLLCLMNNADANLYPGFFSRICRCGISVIKHQEVRTVLQTLAKDVKSFYADAMARIESLDDR